MCTDEFWLWLVLGRVFSLEQVWIPMLSSSCMELFIKTGKHYMTGAASSYPSSVYMEPFSNTITEDSYNTITFLQGRDLQTVDDVICHN